MIERLLETAQPAGGTPRIDQRISDHFLKNFRADMMRTGKSREHSVQAKAT